MKCYNCGKTVIFGRSHTHHRGVAGGRWKKRAPKTDKMFHPNLQKVKIMVNGKVKRVHLCANCLKRVKKDLRDGVKPKIQLLANESAKVKSPEVKKEEKNETKIKNQKSKIKMTKKK